MTPELDGVIVDGDLCDRLALLHMYLVSAGMLVVYRGGQSPQLQLELLSP